MLPQRTDSELLPYLQHSLMAVARQWVAMPQDLDCALTAAAERLANAESHWQYFNDDHRRLFHSARLETLEFTPAREFEPVMGELWPLYDAVLLLSGLSDLVAYAKAFDIPEPILRHTLEDFGLWAKEYYDKHGVWGIGDELPWLQHHFTGRLFRLGRLQFMLSRYEGQAYAYRDMQTQGIVVLAGGDLEVRGDGFVNGSCGRTEEGWHPVFKQEESRIAGHRAVDGCVQAETSLLPLNRFTPVLTPGDTIIEIHIAKDGALSPESCDESFAMALDFFPRYFPNDPFSAFTCHSWLLTPAFPRILPPCNIRHFRERFTLLPARNSEEQLFERVFDCAPTVDRSTLPRDTSLRRAILDALAHEELPDGYGFMLRDQIK